MRIAYFSETFLPRIDGIVNTVAYSADGQIIASGGGTVVSSKGAGNVILLWNAAAPESPLRQLSGLDGQVTRLAFDPQGRYLASASLDGMGTPPQPLCWGAVEVAKPTAPAAMASATMRAISSTSPAVAARSTASPPMT